MARLESCPTCGNQTSENASQCPACGEPLSPGWADAVSEKREREEAEREEAERQEEEEAAWRAGVQATRAKKAKWKKRLYWVSAFAALIVWANWPGMFGDSHLGKMKEADPAEIKMRILKLEEQVAKLPASDFSENIRLYKKLQKLNPDSALYADKITHNQRKQNEAEATAKTEKILKLEEQVAKVPASDFNENIRLYRELQKLNPDSARYSDKIAHYQRKEKAAEAEVEDMSLRPQFANAVEIEKQAFITNVPLKDVDVIVGFVRSKGYRCDSVTVARPFIGGGRGYVLECNYYSYKYEIEDRGGRWVVCFKEC